MGNWSVKTQIQLKIVSGNNRFVSAENTFGNTNPQSLLTSYGWADFMNWETMMSECVIDDTLEVEAHVLIKKMTGFYGENLIHFNDEALSDVMIAIGETKFYLSKQFLAAQSSYFKDLFLEKQKKAKKTVEGIVLLAKHLDFPLAKRQCLEFLLEKSNKSLKKKMQMAEKYELETLAFSCEESINVPDESIPAKKPKLDNVENVTVNLPPPSPKIINEVMEYKSNSALIDTSSTLLDESSNKGLNCVWNGYMIGQKGPISLTWNFDWKELKSQGIDGLSGEIQLKSTNNSFVPFSISVDLTESTQMIEHVIGNAANDIRVAFEYHFIPIYNSYQDVAETSTTVIIEESSAQSASIRTSLEESNPELEIFLPSKKNDTVLVVDAKLLYVNKSFLSYHSDYFDELFSSDVHKDKGSENQDQYSIDDVKYEDFELLIRAIHMNTGFPDG
ncbi:hypothetical protein GCK72_000472 [Caenorhabditis remanei]|uniref:BTB domain-containing protein n=1 Tax=Caenorhabditis remanei TaxID=31234 RepID=A0A6A5HM51_CAERE|nr:hypothetical protein GCK72_000472 [Caenorhabditis remanei]KAF1768659.1 hypothetical protein GCK72_000472 [Caenorhabditis remanei]